MPHFPEEDRLSKNGNPAQTTESISATPAKLELQQAMIGLEVIHFGQSRQMLPN